MTSRRDVLSLLAGTPLLFRNIMALESSALLAKRRDLADTFTSPPDSARPYVLWMWMGSNISKQGITRDLEAMHEAGIGGATIFSLADTLTPWAGVILNSPTPAIVTFSEPWWAMVRHAALECRRLGLELILHNCAGYESSGGPWITPEISMQEVVWSEQQVEGGQFVQANLRRAEVDPHPHAQFPIVYIPSLKKDGIPVVEARRTYYRDIAVIALPSKGQPPMTSIIDLTGKMDEEGNLHWNAPAGNWSVYRFGHTTTGAMIQPAQWEAMGLECDKMSVEAVTFHCRHVLDDIKLHVGDVIGNPGLSTFYFDSYEAGTPNWTPKMREEFRNRRGYELTPFLPVLAGRILVNDEVTKTFQRDLKRTIADLYRDCYWATPRSLAHEYGLKFVAEPYEGPWEVSEVMQYLDTANMEFWTHKGQYSPTANRPVIDTAHQLRQKIIGAEAFTTAPELANWHANPAWLKSIGDAAFCDGVNRMNIHHFVHQPWGSEYQPGMAMGQWGIHLGRYQTWWEPSKAWIKYLWRCQALLQMGEFVPASMETDVRFTQDPKLGLDMRSIHRVQEQEHIYFLANIAGSGGRAICSFQDTDLQSQVWDPVWGSTRHVPARREDGRLILELEFAKAQSYFVVFRKASKPSVVAAFAEPTLRPIKELSGPWLVHFNPLWGGPSTIVFETLDDWSKRPEEGIRYYSGTAVYEKTLHLNLRDKGRRHWLDLGVVKDLATVTINDKRVAVVWTAPWRIDISHVLRSGLNKIEIAVVNGWANRLIGDEQQPADVRWKMGDPILKGGYFLEELPEWFLKKEPRPSPRRYTFTTWNYFNDNNAGLASSGLLGPVKIMGEVSIHQHGAAADSHPYM